MNDYTSNDHVVYLMKNIRSGLVKIGMTNDVYRRWYELRRAYSEYVFVRYALIVSDRQHAFKLETALHRHFSNARRLGEWFDLSTSDVLAHIYITSDLREMVSDVVAYPDVVFDPPKPKQERKPMSMMFKATLVFMGYCAYSLLWLYGVMSGALYPESWEVWGYLFVMVASIIGMCFSLYGYLWETVRDEVYTKTDMSDKERTP